MNRYKFGVAGTGVMGIKHCHVLNQHKNADFIGVYDINRERCEYIALRYGVTPFPSYAELLSSVDAVIIAVPASFHYNYACEAIENGKHVFIEKPITGSLSEAEALNEIFESSRQICFQVGHIERFNPAVQQLFEQVNSQNIISIEARRVCLSNRNQDIDVILDLMIHDIDIILHFINSPLKSVFAAGADRRSGHRLDQATAVLTFQNGVVATLTANRTSVRNERTLWVSETDRVVRLDYNSRELLIYLHPEKSRTVEHLIEQVRILPADPLQSEIEHFIDSIQMQQSPVISSMEGIRALTVALKIRESLDKNEVLFIT